MTGVLLEEHIRRAFSSTSRTVLERLDSAHRAWFANFVAVNEISEATEDSNAVLVGRLVYSSKRGGALKLEDDTGSIPLALTVGDRDPKLFNSIVALKRFQIAAIVKWNEQHVVLADEWTEILEDMQQPSEKPCLWASKGLVPERRNTFYVEASHGVEVLLSERSDRSEVNNGSTMLHGIISAMSPVISSGESTTSETYWLIELTDGKVLVVFGKQNEGIRMLLKIGWCYCFSGLKLDDIRFGTLSMRAYICTQQHSFICNIDNTVSTRGNSSRFARNIGLKSSVPTKDHKGHFEPSVNLFSYQGYITGRPADQVIELDHAYKIVLNRVSKGTSLGLRLGALVVFRSVCQLSWRGKMIGFEGTLRTEVEVVEFSKSKKDPQIRFPLVNAPRYHSISGIAYFQALSCTARYMRFCSWQPSLSSRQVFSKALSEAVKDNPVDLDDFGYKLDRGIHPVGVFLYDWEVPFSLNASLSMQTSLEQAVLDATAECTFRTVRHVKHFKEVFLICELRTSQLTGQLCLIGESLTTTSSPEAMDDRACVECVLHVDCELFPLKAGRTIRVDEFDVIIERGFPPESETALPTKASIRKCLQFTYPKTSMGKCLWHGYLSDEDIVGFTRSFIVVRKAHVVDPEPNTLVNGPLATEHSDYLPLPSSIAYDFSSEGDAVTVFSSIVMVPQQGLDEQRQVVRSEAFPDDFGFRSYLYNPSLLFAAADDDDFETFSVAQLVRSRRFPKRLFFVIKQAHIVQPRRFHSTFEGKRRAKRQRRGVNTTSFFTSWALKLVVRDLNSPMFIDIFLSLEDRVLPPFLLSPPNDLVWMLTGGSLVGEDRVYVDADAKSSLVPVYALARPHAVVARLKVASYPEDLKHAPIGSLSELRASKYHCGSCVLLVVVQVFWARYSFTCPRRCSPPETCLCPLVDDHFKLQVLVEADDGTDQCQVFAENDKAMALLDIPHKLLREYCGHAARRLRRIEYKLNAECEQTSPQGLLRRFLLNGSNASRPRRAYVVKDRPLGGTNKKDALLSETFQFDAGYAGAVSTGQGDGGGNVQDDQMHPSTGPVEDFSRFAYVRTWQDVRVKTCLRQRLTVSLAEVEPQPREELELQRILHDSDSDQ